MGRVRDVGVIPLHRLVESRFQGDVGAEVEWCVNLLKAAVAYPEALGARKQRVWMGLAHPLDRGRGVAIRRVVFAAILLAVGGATAIASAALGKWPDWATRAYERLLPQVSRSVAEPQRWAAGHAKAKAKRVAPTGSTEEGASSVDEGDDDADVAQPTRAETAGIAAIPTAASGSDLDGPELRSSLGSGTPSHRRHRPRRVRHVATFAAAAGSAEDNAAVLEAMRSLRRDHDPARARALLGAYLQQHPRGALAEEALAISIEAAEAHHDADAGVLADRYRHLYPSGPFHLVPPMPQKTLTASGPR